MFSGKKGGSLRKALYKQRKKSDSSSSATSNTSQPQIPGGVPLSTPPTPALEDLYQDLPEGFPHPPSPSPAASGIPTLTRLRVNKGNAVGGSTQLTVDVGNSNCSCNGVLRESGQLSSTSTATTKCSLHDHPTNHPTLAHHRSISASPHTTSGASNTIGEIRSVPNTLNVPLLIPLGGGGGGVSRKSSRGGTLQHRLSLSGTSPHSRSPNIFLAARLEHPTVFDFEDWHTSLDKQSQEAVYSLFFRAHKCYDLIPSSSKLVVFDTELPVSKAFYALVYNGVRAAPLWDNKVKDFVGMLTITDFIQILNKYYIKGDHLGDGMKQLEAHKIATWRDVFQKDGHLKQFVTIDPSESLHRAVQVLCDSKIHRLPVLESTTGNILYILTHKRLIKFLWLYISDLPKPSYMDKTPKELGIGTWGNVQMISKDNKIIDAMKIFLQKRVSALPLVDEDGRVMDIYCKFDAISLAADNTYNNLDIPVHEALKGRSDWFEGVRQCSVNDSLITVIETIVKAEVHRLIVTDDEKRVAGIVSLSDILKHLIIDPPQPEGDPADGATIPLLISGGGGATDMFHADSTVSSAVSASSSMFTPPPPPHNSATNEAAVPMDMTS